MDEQEDRDRRPDPTPDPAKGEPHDTGVLPVTPDDSDHDIWDLSDDHDDEPPAPRTPRKRLPAWAVAAIAVGIFVVAFVVMRYVVPGTGSAAGDCASVTGADENAALSPLSCDDDNATFRIASTKDAAQSCPEGAYRELRDGGTLRCLMPNFLAGRCYEPDDANRAFRQAGCDSAEALRVTGVLEGVSDPEPCPGGNGLGYPEPPVVYCLETPGT